LKPLRDCRLYTFIDSAYLHGRSLPEMARALCDGGSDLIQLRAKDWEHERIERAAAEIHPILSAAGVGLVVNDSPSIARSVGAEFCHLGQEDFFDSGHRHVDEFRTAGPRLGFGLSSHAPDQAQRAVEAGADYVAIGPVYATPTKRTAKPVTLDYVRWAAENLEVPWFAIGGINASTVDEVLAAGARRICVVSAILNAPDISRACRGYRDRLELVRS
jgi:thiamine-phosphate pyrophosphorylase